MVVPVTGVEDGSLLTEFRDATVRSFCEFLGWLLMKFFVFDYTVFGELLVFTDD